MTTRRPDPVECPDFDDMRDYPHGAPLTIKGKLQAGRRDASFLASPDVHSFKVNHVIVASRKYAVGRGIAVAAAACDPAHIMIYTGSVYDADTTNPDGRCQRPACQRLFDQALGITPLPPRIVPDDEKGMLSPARCIAPDCGAVFDAAEPWPFGWLAERGPSSRYIHLCPLHSGAWDSRDHRPKPAYRLEDRGCACGFRPTRGPEGITNDGLDQAYALHLTPFLRPNPDLEAAELLAARKVARPRGEDSLGR
ncbi:hypothetical protein [Streptomyces sp. NPDC002547]